MMQTCNKNQSNLVPEGTHLAPFDGDRTGAGTVGPTHNEHDVPRLSSALSLRFSRLSLSRDRERRKRRSRGGAEEARMGGKREELSSLELKAYV